MLDCDPQSIPLEHIDVSQAELYEHDRQDAFFTRLRAESPVHRCAESAFGPYWSITRFDDIVAVESDFETFSSEPNILIADQPDDFEVRSFITMDPPEHDSNRAAVQGAVAPQNLKQLEGVIRERVGQILDGLPVGETFDWVDRVSIELTTQMLATLFDFPFEERRRLTRWSDIAIATPELSGSALVTEEQRRAELGECLQTFLGLWQQRAARPEGFDLISMLARGEATRDLPSRPMDLLGTLMLLIVGGNDTTRNSISGGVVALNRNPEEYAKLRANPGLIPNMVSEIIRWQSPVLHMRRRATRDVELGGQTIREGDKVVMWYISGNRDGDAILDPFAFRIDRERARHHVAFGFGIHRCMGNRLGELQLRLTWEEVMKRFEFVELVGEPVRTRSNFIRGIAELPVRLHRRH
ncbi:MAG: cytochrome P450 [Gammaproteobacteria bacterium]|nr:cytochrome P450 [Gammaproteobacteria bacterium]MCP5202230.1 cytochrome P450 [Gammaproteobacteria bacterium]